MHDSISLWVLNELWQSTDISFVQPFCTDQDKAHAKQQNALIRYQALDKCFRNPGSDDTWEELLEACNQALSDFDPISDGIQRRQLLDDIRFMESEQGWSIPARKKQRWRFYRYADLKFSINNQPINETEANQLKSVLLVLSRFKGLPQFEWINEIIPRFEQSSISGRKATILLVSITMNTFEVLTALAIFFNAILYRKVLSIKYKPLPCPLSIRLPIASLLPQQYNSQVELFLGYNPEVSKITIIAWDKN
ncbi:MAG: hypothetical protein R2791_12330 [Saprospiraceae bacterium]